MKYISPLSVSFNISILGVAMKIVAPLHWALINKLLIHYEVIHFQILIIYMYWMCNCMACTLSTNKIHGSLDQHCYIHTH